MLRCLRAISRLIFRGEGDHDGINRAIDVLFSCIDADGSGSLDADELLSLVLAMGDSELDMDAVTSLIHEVDVNGDGHVQRDEFVALLHPVEPVAESALHLILNFDVNQTVCLPSPLLSTVASC